MNFRLWYPQLDIYDTIRRMTCLLSNWSFDPISPERLSILDFYLSSPALLHGVNMTQETRLEFQRLQVVNQKKEFLSYPAAPILFQKMEEIQKGAIRTLVGKELILQDRLTRNEVLFSERGKQLAQDHFLTLVTESEQAVLKFLTSRLGAIGLRDIRELRRRTGLRRAVQ